VNLNVTSLPSPRLTPKHEGDVLMVPVFTDFKLHDISDPQSPYDAEPLDMNQHRVVSQVPRGQPPLPDEAVAGLRERAAILPPWAVHNIAPVGLAHSGEAIESRRKFQNLSSDEQDALIEFLRSLQVLPPGAKNLVVDEHFVRRHGLPWDHDEPQSGTFYQVVSAFDNCDPNPAVRDALRATAGDAADR
jgi:hypothetical protein